jgi:hypothetical protein
MLRRRQATGLEGYDTAESSLQDITTVDGSSIYTIKKVNYFPIPRQGITD